MSVLCHLAWKFVLTDECMFRPIEAADAVRKKVDWGGQNDESEQA